MTKKRRSRLFLCLLAAVVAIAAAAVWYFFLRDGAPYKRPDEPKGETPAIRTGELTIRFFELGNKYAGDCTLVKCGDVELLIDAGSRKGSAKAVGDLVADYCADGVLEYVVATHAHQDHIAAFVGTKSEPGIFERFECKTIIDFPRTDSDTQIYREYVAEREKEVAAGAAHYTALDCWKGENGGSRSYDLGENVKFEILYQRYYEEHSADENNYSVCLLVTQGNFHYLFTGDLEEEGEESLVRSNELPACKLFKGGHHGSATSSNDFLLEKIRPEYVCVCCCAGSPEYYQQVFENIFPSQAMIDRVSRYTKSIYVTSLAVNVDLEAKKWDYTSMNGNITVRSDGLQVSVECSNDPTILKDTEWFKANRTWPAYGVR